MEFSEVSTAILICQNAFLLTWNSCIRGPGRMKSYFLQRVVWNENKIWTYWENLAKSLPSGGCQLLWLLPVSSFGFCTLSNFAEYLSVSNLHSGAKFFFFFLYLFGDWRVKASPFPPRLPPLPSEWNVCFLSCENRMWMVESIKLCCGWNLLWLLIESAQLQICVLVDLNSFRHIGQRYN